MRSSRVVRLGEVADLLTGFPFKSEQYTSDLSGIKLVRGDNIVQGALRWNGVKRWPASLANGFEDYELAAGDVVLAMDRPWIEAGLKYAALTRFDCPALLVQRVTRLRGTKQIDSQFLRYVIGSKRFTDYILSVQTGTAVPHISSGQIKAYEFSLPSLPQQKAIASILASLDDKIAINQRTNGTLESIVRAIFDDWFVQFGPTRAKMKGEAPYLDADVWSSFPDLISSEGEPVGWSRFRLEDLAVQHTRGISPASAPDETFEHYSLPAYDSGRSPALQLGFSIKSNKTVIPPKAILLSKLNPEIERVWIPEPPSQHRQISSTEFLVFTPTEISNISLLYGLFTEPSFRANLLAGVTGTSNSHQRISPQRLLTANAIIADPVTIDLFGKLVMPLLQRSVLNVYENRKLASTRDLLLPKLLDGGVTVPDAERKIGELV